MQCSICQEGARPMYCAHCMSTSPHLLLKLKIDLLALREANNRLKDRVEDILEYGLDQIAGKNASSAIISNTNVEGDVLGKRLRKLDSLILKKKNNRVRYRISQLKHRIRDKKIQVTHLHDELQGGSCETGFKKEESGTREKLIIAESREQLIQIRKVVLRSQLSKIKSLVEWFVIRKRDSYDFPYTLAFQPIVSLRNIYKLPPSVVWGSISTVSRYLKLFSEILFFTLPHNELISPNASELELKISAKAADESSGNSEGETAITDHLTKIFINIIQISRRLNLISKDPIDLAWMLDQNDLDTLFYNMAMRLETKSKPVSHHWTYRQTLAVVSEALQLSSVYAISPISRQPPSGATAKNSDRWYLVR